MFTKRLKIVSVRAIMNISHKNFPKETQTRKTSTNIIGHFGKLEIYMTSIHPAIHTFK